MYSLIIKKSIFPVLASAVFIFFALATDVYANPNKAKTLFISAQVAYENKQYDDAIQA